MIDVVKGLPGVTQVTLPDGTLVLVMRDVGEGDPMKLLEKRFRTYRQPLVFGGSTTH